MKNSSFIANLIKHSLYHRTYRSLESVPPFQRQTNGNLSNYQTNLMILKYKYSILKTFIILNLNKVLQCRVRNKIVHREALKNNKKCISNVYGRSRLGDGGDVCIGVGVLWDGAGVGASLLHKLLHLLPSLGLLHQPLEHACLLRSQVLWKEESIVSIGRHLCLTLK